MDNRKKQAIESVGGLLDQQRDANEFDGDDERRRDAADAKEVAEYSGELSEHTAVHPGLRRAESRVRDLLAERSVDDDGAEVESDEQSMAAHCGSSVTDDEGDLLE